MAKKKDGGYGYTIGDQAFRHASGHLSKKHVDKGQPPHKRLTADGGRSWDESKHPRKPAGTEVGGEFASSGGGMTSSNSERDDLKSSFSASLKEAHSMSTEAMQRAPARTAMVIVEGALESPSHAKTLFDKASHAFNSMPQQTPRQISAQVETMKNFRFALQREIERAQHAAPKRWAKIQKMVSE